MHYILDQVQLLRDRFHTSSPDVIAEELGIDIQQHHLGSLKGYYLAAKKETSGHLREVPCGFFQ